MASPRQARPAQSGTPTTLSEGRPSAIGTTGPCSGAVIARKPSFTEHKEVGYAVARPVRFAEPDQCDLGSPVLLAKIFPFPADPNQLYIPSVLSHRGAFRDRHGRGVGCGGRGSVGHGLDGRAGFPVSDREAC